MTSGINKAYKFSLFLAACLLFRLLPFRAPNIEPITAALMPFGRAYGKVSALIFGVLSVLIYDTLTGTLGVHTFFTAGAFGMLGVWSGVYFKDAKGGIGNYVGFAILATLFFDAATGLVIGPVFNGQPFIAALTGQIPFTMLHLAGNIAFAVTLSPTIYYLLVKKRKPDPKPFLTSRFNLKII